MSSSSSFLSKSDECRVTHSREEHLKTFADPYTPYDGRDNDGLRAVEAVALVPHRWIRSEERNTLCFDERGSISSKGVGCLSIGGPILLTFGRLAPKHEPWPWVLFRVPKQTLK